MKFSDIPGQAGAKQALREPVDTGHVPHALMITGPSGAGKMLLARAFAQYLHCENPHDGEPCGVCNSCKMHVELNHPDLKFVFPVPKKDNISADFAEQWQQMLRDYPAMPEEKWSEILEAGTAQPAIFVKEANEIVRSDAMPAYSAKNKIFIIWLPEKMNLQTANKLLKVIEEPSEGTVFVMVSNNDLQVLPTIFSRVQRIHAGRLSDSEIEGYLAQRYHMPEHTAMSLARLCEGSLIRADEIGSNAAESDEFLLIYQEIMRSAYSKRVQALKQQAEKLATFGREKIKRFLDYTARMIRENFIYNLGMPQLRTMTPAEESFSVKFSPFVNHANVEDFLSEINRARRDIESNANAKIVLFDFFILVIILLHRKPN